MNEFSYHNLDFTSATTIIRWLSDLWIQRRTATIEFNICWQAPKHSSMMNSLNCVEFSYHNLDFTSATTIIRWLSDLWIQRRTATIEFNICWQAPKHSSMMNSLNCVEFSYHNLDFTSATTIIRWLSDLWIQRRTATIEFNICWQAPKHSSMMNSLNCVEFSYHNLDFTSATTIIRWLSDLWIQRRTATIEFNICWQVHRSTRQ